MFWLSWLQAGGATRGKPAQERHRRRSWPALGLLACMALLQSGCQSGPFSHCGDGTGLFSPCGFFGRVQSRIFNRSNPAGACCEPGVVSGTPVEYATPGAVVTPGVVPSYPSGGATRSYDSSGSTDTSTELNPVDPNAKAKIVSPPGSGASRTGPQGASYQTRGSDTGARIARRRTDNPSRTTVTTSEPTARSAQAATGAASGGQTARDVDPLDNIPPLDLPGDVQRSSSTPPAPPSAQPAAEPGHAAVKKPDLKNEAPAPPANEVELTSITLPAPEPAPSASVGPGLARFVAVDLKLAGGSLPSSAGLDWLVEKGYRTLLDLRESSEVSSSFIAEVTRKGLRYVALPIGPGSIDREHVARFQFEIAASEARPLYFFDSDGTRSGALWYVRRIATDRVDDQVARREAEELGLLDKAYWSAVTNYVARSVKPEITPTVDGSSQGTKTHGAPSSTPTTGTTKPSKESQPPVDAALPGNLLVWRSFTALVITCVGLPLAQWSRNHAAANRAKTPASLPAPAPESKSIRGESGA
jgi:protein tyrosine phosphatase (PTP) superfamily phosphohydrolase (DUF442 family)